MMVTITEIYSRKENVRFVWLFFYISYFRIFPPIRVPSFSSDSLFALLYLLLKKNLWNPRNSSARMLRVSSKFQIVTNKSEITLTLTALTSLFLLRFFYLSLFPSLFRVKCESVFCLMAELGSSGNSHFLIYN